MNPPHTFHHREDPMKRRIAGLVLMTSMVIATTVMASTVKYDYDREVDFSGWKTMAWRRLHQAGESMREKRIRRAVEDGFKAKKYVLLDTRTQADFLIEYSTSARQDLQFNETLMGPGFGRSARIEAIPTGTLIVDVYDGRTGRLAWRGMVTDTLANDPNDADKKTAKAVTKLLKKFPPEKKR
jgi:hypothetical protein